MVFDFSSGRITLLGDSALLHTCILLISLQFAVPKDKTLGNYFLLILQKINLLKYKPFSLLKYISALISSSCTSLPAAYT